MAPNLSTPFKQAYLTSCRREEVLKLTGFDYGTEIEKTMRNRVRQMDGEGGREGGATHR